MNNTMEVSKIAKDKVSVFTEYFGLIADDEEGTLIYGFENISQARSKGYFNMKDPGGIFGYVDKGELSFQFLGKTVTVTEGFWFSCPGATEFLFLGDAYRVSMWQRQDYDGLMSMGFVEPAGRLEYIDDCHDSMLHHPIKFGEPCLNALYMPQGVLQTRHTHPSTRSGFIIHGGARCETPNQDIQLESGMIFFLPTDVEHNFRSDHGENITMKLVAYHPDSDFGATDEVHPMINRTIVDGISAANLPDIQTGRLRE